MGELITIGNLNHFKEKQEADAAQKYLKRIPAGGLPTEDVSIGEMAFYTQEERMYIYTSKGWRPLPYLDELVLTYTTSGATFTKEA